MEMCGEGLKGSPLEETVTLGGQTLLKESSNYSSTNESHCDC